MYCDSDVSITIEFADSALEYTCSDADGSAQGSYTFERTWTATATDDCGNASSVSATFTIEDTTAPVFDDYIPTTVVECTDGDGDDLNYLPLTAQDDCSDVTYTVESMCMSGGCLWTIMRIWTATDDCGNSTTVEQYLMLSDTTAPEVTAPARSSSQLPSS